MNQIRLKTGGLGSRSVNRFLRVIRLWGEDIFVVSANTIAIYLLSFWIVSPQFAFCFSRATAEKRSSIIYRFYEPTGNPLAVSWSIPLLTVSSPLIQAYIESYSSHLEHTSVDNLFPFTPPTMCHIGIRFRFWAYLYRLSVSVHPWAGDHQGICQKIITESVKKTNATMSELKVNTHKCYLYRNTCHTSLHFLLAHHRIN